MKPICVIPARLGSKRLLRKNMALLKGRPLLQWTVEAALASGIFSAVNVSTESDYVADHAKSWGAHVPALRSEDLAGDTVTNVAVCLDFYDRHCPDRDAGDVIVCLQPSSPLRSGDHIRGAWKRMVESGSDFLASVTAIDPHYFHWALTERDGGWGMYFGDQYMTVRQKLPSVFRPNGAIKMARVAALRARQNFFGAPLTAYEMPEEASVHVATAADLVMAEAFAGV